MKARLIGLKSRIMTVAELRHLIKTDRFADSIKTRIIEVVE